MLSCFKNSWTHFKHFISKEVFYWFWKYSQILITQKQLNRVAADVRGKSLFVQKNKSIHFRHKNTIYASIHVWYSSGSFSSEHAIHKVCAQKVAATYSLLLPPPSPGHSNNWFITVSVSSSLFSRQWKTISENNTLCFCKRRSDLSLLIDIQYYN